MQVNVLLVDDDAMNQWALGEALTDAGHHVVAAATGDHAGELMAQHPDLDILVTDIALEGPVTGQQLARFWRSRSDRPTVYITGFSPREAGIVSFDAKEAYLQKPFPAEELVRVVERLVAAHRAAGQKLMGWRQPKAC